MQGQNPFATQQTLHINPTKEDRKSTNVPFIIIFAIIFFIWLCIVIKVLNDDSSKTPDEINRAHQITFSAIETIKSRFTWKFPVCTILSGFVVIGYTCILSHSIGRFIVYLGMFLICFLTLSIIVFVIIITRGLEYKMMPILFISLLFIVAYFITSFRCAVNVGTEAIFEIIRDSCRAVICCPSISIFACVMCVTTIVMLTFEIFISKSIILSQDNFSHITLYLFLNIYGATALTNLFINFTQIVISGYVTDWFWTKDQSSSSLTIWRSIERILSFHMGTVAFASIPLLSYILSIFQSCRCRDSNNDIVKKYNIFTRFFSQLCSTMKIVDFAMIQTSIYGYEYTTAIMAAHDLVSQNNHEINLAVSEVSNMVIGIGSSLITIPFLFESMQSSLYAMLIPFNIVLTIVIRTILVNKMIINYTSEALKEDSDSVQIMVL